MAKLQVNCKFIILQGVFLPRSLKEDVRLVVTINKQKRDGINFGNFVEQSLILYRTQKFMKNIIPLDPLSWFWAVSSFKLVVL